MMKGLLTLYHTMKSRSQYIKVVYRVKMQWGRVMPRRCSGRYREQSKHLMG